MKHLSKLILFPLLALVGKSADLSSSAIIPAPQNITVHEGGFVLTAKTHIVADAASLTTGECLAARLRLSTGYPLEVVSTPPGMGDIVLTTVESEGNLGDEGYALDVRSEGVVIHSMQPTGAFYGVQSLLQLFPPQVLSTSKIDGVSWILPNVSIQDKPRFQWRGMMLDSGRYFFPKSEILRLLDSMALLKLNIFHWHLTDDQGWRIEIKKYPKLTEVGAWRESSPLYGDRKSSDGKRYGGFYTQKEIREIVNYAAARHITIVPEIEMPGHAAAAITSYPELGNTDVVDYSPRVMTSWGVKPYTFAPKEETFRFLADVLTEVCDLFPSVYIHVGGDEAPKTQWMQSPFAQSVIRREKLADEDELQSWFIRRIGAFLETKGRRLIGWDEIQEGGLPKTATMMVWRDAKWARHALSLGNDIIMASTSHTYFDYYQNKPSSELAKGLNYEAIGGFLPLETVYSYNPSFVADTPDQEQHILGTQGQLWTEYIQNCWKLEYMMFPRIAALAEIAWTPQEARNFDDFQMRLNQLYLRLDVLGISYYRDNEN